MIAHQSKSPSVRAEQTGTQGASCVGTPAKNKLSERRLPAPLSFSTPSKKNRHTETTLVLDLSPFKLALYCYPSVHSMASLKKDIPGSHTLKRSADLPCCAAAAISRRSRIASVLQPPWNKQCKLFHKDQQGTQTSSKFKVLLLA